MTHDFKKLLLKCISLSFELALIIKIISNLTNLKIAISKNFADSLKKLSQY